MSIDFKNKRIVSTGLNIQFTPGQRDDEWTIEDELMALTMSIQMQLIAKKTGEQVCVYEWFNNIEAVAQATTNKSYECLGNIRSDSRQHEHNYKMLGQYVDDLEIWALDYMGNGIISEAGEKQIAEEKERAKAVAIAKKELKAEQRVLDEIEAREEEMREAEIEANTLKVVHPIKGYLKHDQ